MTFPRALEVRARAGIKVRQPLSEMATKIKNPKIENWARDY